MVVAPRDERISPLVESWLKSSFESFYGDGSGSDNTDCEVIFRGVEISISYRDETTWVTYVGKEITAGHFRLSSKETKGIATLHRFSEATLLEGSWSEGGNHGMWQVNLEK